MKIMLQMVLYDYLNLKNVLIFICICGYKTLKYYKIVTAGLRLLLWVSNHRCILY